VGRLTTRGQIDPRVEPEEAQGWIGGREQYGDDRKAGFASLAIEGQIPSQMNIPDAAAYGRSGVDLGSRMRACSLATAVVA
jgi:hypothetical protein